MLLASRRQLKTEAAGLESTIRGLLKIHGVVLGPANRLSYLSRVREARHGLEQGARLGMEALVASLEHLRAACKSLDAQVKKRASADMRSHLLMSMPGGPLTSTTLVATLDEAGRFTSRAASGRIWASRPMYVCPVIETWCNCGRSPRAVTVPC
jgi:transposase